MGSAGLISRALAFIRGSDGCTATALVDLKVGMCCINTYLRLIIKLGRRWFQGLLFCSFVKLIIHKYL